jgi:glycosyltransferase involved in cell wall biosynthesis
VINDNFLYEIRQYIDSITKKGTLEAKGELSVDEKQISGAVMQDFHENKRVLAVIPCFNEEATIGSVVLKAKRYVDEILVIDDGCNDDTKRVAEEAGAIVISHNTNKGKSAGIKTGFQYALNHDFDYVVTLDGDGQHNANEIPMLLGNILSSEMDISLGIRYGDDTEMPLWRRVGKRVLDYTTSFGNGGLVTDSQCGFRAFNKKALEDITPRLKGDAFSVESEQLILANELGLSASNVHVSCKYNSLKTKTSTEKPTSHGLSVLSYVLWLVAERHPLMFIGLPGLCFVIIGIFIAIRTLQEYNITHVFSIPYALLTSFFLIIGAIAVFIGLLLNTLSQIIKRKIN